ncbi:DsbA family oxidoreductase [Angustibacter aerolatus]
MNEPLQVEIWSDVVCPWCYIGKRRFESAVASTGLPVEVTWRSFQLDPDAPRQDGADVATHLGSRYGGGREAGLAMVQRVQEVAAGEGLDFHLDRAHRANTVDAHRLLHLAQLHGVQDALKEAMLDAYFVQVLDVNDRAVLLGLAEGAGVPRDEAEQVLASDRFADDVRRDQEEAAALGANGVPFFVLDRRFGVSGAQPAELFEQALRQAWDARTPALVTPLATASATADACGPDGC